MAAAAPKETNYGVSQIKSALLQPALTSHYEVWISQPASQEARDFIGLIVKEPNELLKLSCSEASLPGSSLATHELNNDFTGVTQRHVYRRLYDDRIDFTFYVNHTYDQIRFFERWIQFICGEQIALKSPTSFFRVQYPKNYKQTVYIRKFERTVNPPKTGKGVQNEKNGSYTGSSLVYEFINAFPISIGSMPVSYDTSSLLKCTVSFTYDRYIMNDVSKTPNSSESEQLFGLTPETQAAINASYAGNFNLNLSNYSAGTFTDTNFNTFNPTSNTLVEFNPNVQLF